MIPEIRCWWCEARSIPCRGAVIALLLVFCACSPHSGESHVRASNPPGVSSGHRPAPVSPTPVDTGAGGGLPVTDLANAASADSSPKPAPAPKAAAHATDDYYYLLLIGPRESFRNLATTPSDPEVVYVEEATEIRGDGQREQTVMAFSKAAVRRFKAAAKKLGMEVRSLDER